MDDQIGVSFRHAMRRLATTVAIVTSGRGNGWSGMAATAVVSVCADPPTLLVAVNRSSSIHPTMQIEQRFCVNLLAERHKDLVTIFGGKKKDLDRFDDGNWESGSDGLPVLWRA